MSSAVSSNGTSGNGHDRRAGSDITFGSPRPRNAMRTEPSSYYQAS